MGVVDEALTRALAGGPEPRRPNTVRQSLAEYDGNRAALARDIEGLEPAPAKLPVKGTPERRSYDATKRSIDRYTTTAGQKRGAKRPNTELVRRAVEAATPNWARRVARWRVQLAGRLRRARRRGLDMRIRAWIQVSKLCKVHTMPADMGGRSRYVHISPELAGEPLDRWEAGELEDAGDALTRAFFIAYLLPEAVLCGAGVEWAEVARP